MTDKQDDGAWFSAKTYGYGAGLPVAWQGWAVLGGYLATMLFAGLLIESYQEEGAVFAIPMMLFATLGLILIAGAKTRGGIRWRWGGKDD
ncbi:hypothetical protein [Qipengyuania soli]|uniref:Uncharacterized protein n=1 Tax=Qipengyuania soli TaxID=2782568 RepID=A0A7S8F1W0_9SPHN|nr:hypothetical protein [Qipengyuania soli]QPC98870.1 hypothetical protein IRL76_13725 [Qipengyuania soli]